MDLAASVSAPGAGWSCPDLAPLLEEAEPHPDLAWAASGAMALTGAPGSAPVLAPAPLASAMAAAAAALGRLAGGEGLARLDAPALLGERAAVFGYRRRGPVSPGGSCRLLPAADGWLAVNLARADDRELLPAWVGVAGGSETWSALAGALRERPVAELVARARLLGLPVARAAAPSGERVSWCRVVAEGPRVERPPAAAPLVVDLSALWAGPLCTHLLGLAGARVVKVESCARPDGARQGPAAFYDLLNAGKASVALDLGAAAGRRQLRGLLERADVVVESARPRALAQLGICAEALVAARPGLTWVSITGYGRAEPAGSWVAFGDDAAAAAGLAVATGTPGAPLFCGDAIADPLTGAHAAVAALASFRAGGGRLLDVSLRDVVAHWLARPSGAREARVEPSGEVVLGAQRVAVRPPRARSVTGAARALGADNRAVFDELGLVC